MYLHWGAEGRGCPTAGQRELARSLADAGADVVVGAHAHVLLGAGMLGDTYVSYGLGNFLWYHGGQPDTGVLRLQIVDGEVVRDDWVPGEIRPTGRSAPSADRIGAPRRDPGVARSARLHRPRAGTERRRPPSPPAARAGLPAYAASIEPVPSAVRRRMTGSSHDPARCPVGFADLRLLTMRYVGFDGRAHTGQMVVHRRHARDLVGVFRELYEARFPIRRMQLVDAYGGDDNRSMAADNTSAYNCRTVAGTSTFSAHAYGAAVDINPVENPYVTADGVLPAAGRRFVDVDRARGRRRRPKGSSSRTTSSSAPSRGSAGSGAASGTRPTTSTSTRPEYRRPLRSLLVLEGQLDLRAVDELATVTDVDVLLDDLGDPEVPDRLARRVDRVRGSLLPGGRARADDVDHPVDAHSCPPRWMCRSARFGTVMISHSRAEGNERMRINGCLKVLCIYDGYGPTARSGESDG